METQDFKAGWRVKIYDHRHDFLNGFEGHVAMVAKYVIYVETDDGDVFTCLPHELIILDKNV